MSCAECGKEGGAILKVCKACMRAKYCSAVCQRNHWPTHRAECKIRVAELRDEALFKDPPAKEDCPICFLPMPVNLISCILLPDAAILSVPTYDFAIAHEELASKDMETYFPCCGKTICRGCAYSSCMSGNDKCPFCSSDQASKTVEEKIEEVMKRVAANDPASICMLGNQYHHGLYGFQQNHVKAIEQYTRAGQLGCSKAYDHLADIYHEGGNLKKAKFHYEAAAMAGHEGARNNIGIIEAESRNIERAFKHWIIAASAGEYHAMNCLIKIFEKGLVSRETIDSTLAAYNNSCAEMRSEARDACIQIMML